MKRIRSAFIGCMTLGAVLGADAQKRLPISGSTVPPIGGQTTSSSNGPDNSRNGGSFGSLAADDGDLTVRRNMEALQLNRLNVERQRVIARESAQLLQMVAELHLKMTQETASGASVETQKQLDAIEKLARDVKDRMKGAR